MCAFKRGRAGNRDFGRSGGIRTHDLLSPRQARYQAAPRSDKARNIAAAFTEGNQSVAFAGGIGPPLAIVRASAASTARRLAAPAGKVAAAVVLSPALGTGAPSTAAGGFNESSRSGD